MTRKTTRPISERHLTQFERAFERVASGALIVAPTAYERVAMMFKMMYDVGMYGEGDESFRDQTYADLTECAIGVITDMLIFVETVDPREGVPVTLSRVFNDFTLLRREMSAGE